MGLSLTQLIPLQELTPGQVGKIRNDAINAVVAKACRELSKLPDDLIVRDILSYTDLGWDYGTATAGTTNKWVHSATAAAIGYSSMTGPETMADNRYVAIFGVRDYSAGLGCTGSTGGAGLATAGGQSTISPGIMMMSLIKFSVGGADKVIWDITSLRAYLPSGIAVAFSPSVVVIPQNTAFNIYFYQQLTNADIDIFLQLIGVTVEPRGKLISP